MGPRQCGKTTLARALGGRYFDLEQEADRLRLDLDWRALTAAVGTPAPTQTSADLLVLDEAQSWPEIFPRLRGAIDLDRKRVGRFLILGSVSPALMRQVSESLAGRMALIELSPFLLQEVGEERLREAWLVGGFPDGGILERGRFPRWQNDYLSLLAQRDLPNWGLPAKPQTTERLLRMIAAGQGQLWNASRLGQSLGLSYATINSYLDYLEGAFLVRRLPPFHANLKKRLVKSSKVYLRDSGLLHALLRISREEDLLSQPWVGASWEGFVIQEILGFLSTLGAPSSASFLRTSDQYEIDLILEINAKLWAIEVKLTSQPSQGDIHRLEKTAGLIGADRVVLISQTAELVRDEKTISCSLPRFLEVLERELA